MGVSQEIPTQVLCVKIPYRCSSALETQREINSTLFAYILGVVANKTLVFCTVLMHTHINIRSLPLYKFCFWVVVFWLCQTAIYILLNR